jgi:thiol:disulfide interchange protein
MNLSVEQLEDIVDRHRLHYIQAAAAFIGFVFLVITAVTMHALWMIVLTEVLEPTGVLQDPIVVSTIEWVFGIPPLAIIGYLISVVLNGILEKEVDHLETTLAIIGIVGLANLIRIGVFA